MKGFIYHNASLPTPRCTPPLIAQSATPQMLGGRGGSPYVLGIWCASDFCQHARILVWLFQNSSQIALVQTLVLAIRNMNAVHKQPWQRPACLILPSPPASQRISLANNSLVPILFTSIFNIRFIHKWLHFENTN